VCSVPIRIQERVLYTIGEALAQAELSRSTYFRWVRLGRIADTQYKDRNGRRVFTKDEVEDLAKVAHQLQDTQIQSRFEFQERPRG
jgi:DNA-binding transcriptional MerR regulator